MFKYLNIKISPGNGVTQPWNIKQLFKRLYILYSNVEIADECQVKRQKTKLYTYTKLMYKKHI